MHCYRNYLEVIWRQIWVTVGPKQKQIVNIKQFVLYTKTIGFSLRVCLISEANFKCNFVKTRIINDRLQINVIKMKFWSLLAQK